MNLQIGQKVFLKPINNASRHGRNEIREEVILKIGKKYFFVGDEGVTNEKMMTKFSLESLQQVSNYSPNWQLHFSKQEILDEREAQDLIKQIRDKIGPYGKTDLNLEQLRRIRDILSE